MARAPVLLLCLAAGLAPRAAEAENPITRVVGLMEGLVKKITADGKAEEDLFEGYVCWYKTVTSTKKAANAAAADRIEALTTYIDDIKGGKIEFTTERKDLEVEVQKVSEEVETQKALRKKEKEDYLAAKNEMQRAIAALEKAVEVLGGGGSAAALTSVGFDVRRVLDLGRNSLNAADAKLLEDALDGADKEGAPDWKKLNMKNSFSMKYSKRNSNKIEEILSDMLQTFKDNLADATAKEDESKANSEKLLERKESQLAEAQEALAAGTEEAEAMAKEIAEAQEEIDALKAQVKADEGYIKEAEDSFADMSSQWKERKRLRAEEIAAISKAMAVLSSDDAKDTISASFKSQTGLFLQGAGSHEACLATRAKKASQHVRGLAEKLKSSRLAMLAVDIRFRTKGNFDKVVGGIDKIISDIHKENDEDLKVKEDCEDDRNKNTKTAKNMAYDIDTQTSLIVRKTAEVDAKNKEIARLNDEKKETELQQEEATINRKKEKLEFEKSKSDDAAALELLKKASAVLSKFYSDNNLAMLQRSSQPVVEAGAAPPPPPTTWSEPYGGAKGETKGIQAIMEMIKEDIEKDMKEAEAAETEAIKVFEAFMQSTGEIITKIENDIVMLEGEIGDCEEVMKEARQTRTGKKKIMDDSLMYLRSIAEGCDFMAANFEFRKQSREEETDGLLEAEAMLQGANQGSFKAGLLQKRSALEAAEESC